MSDLADLPYGLRWGDNRFGDSFNVMGPVFFGTARRDGHAAWFDKVSGQQRKQQLIAANSDRSENGGLLDPVNFDVCYDRANKLQEMPNGDFNLHISLKYNGIAVRGRVFIDVLGRTILAFYTENNAFPPIILKEKGVQGKSTELCKQLCGCLSTDNHTVEAEELENYIFIAEFTTADLTNKPYGYETLSQATTFLNKFCCHKNSDYGYVFNPTSRLVEYKPRPTDIAGGSYGFDNFYIAHVWYRTYVTSYTNLQFKLIAAVKAGEYTRQPALIKTLDSVDANHVKGVKWDHIQSKEDYTRFVQKYIDTHHEGFVMERVSKSKITRDPEHDEEIPVSGGLVKLKHTSAALKLDTDVCNKHGIRDLGKDVTWRVRHPTHDVWLEVKADKNDGRKPKGRKQDYFYLIYYQLCKDPYVEFAIPCSETTIRGNIYRQKRHLGLPDMLDKRKYDAEDQEQSNSAQEKPPKLIRRARSGHMGEDGIWQEHRQSHEETDLAAAMRNVYLVDLGGLVCLERI